MKIVKVVLLSVSLATLTGCMGQMGLSKDLQKWNMKVSKDRWVREGIFVGLHVLGVSPIVGMIDLLGLNAVEFWTGTNPYTKRGPAVVDMAAADFKRVGVENVAKAKIYFDGQETVKLEVLFKDGHTEFVSAIEKDSTFDFYQGGDLIASAPKEELIVFAQNR